MTCTVPGCDRKTVAKGMCMRHYKQARAGAEVGVELRIGEPSGHGRFGVMERTEDAALCHECGGWFVSVGSHAYLAHELTAREYRQRHGLARSTPLVSLGMSRRRSEDSRSRVGSAGWRRLEAARDPQAAADARQPDDFRAPAAIAAKEPTSTANLPSKAARVKVCRVCGAEYTGRRRLCSEECVRAVKAATLARSRPPTIGADQAAALRQADEETLAGLVRDLQAQGFSSASIGRALGKSGVWMTKRFPRPGRIRNVALADKNGPPTR